jgi:hypothetical protein
MMSRYKTSFDIKNLNQVVMPTAYAPSPGVVVVFSSKERKGIRFQFRNLLSIRLSLASRR